MTRLRHNLAHLAEDQFEEVQRQLEMVAITDGPKAYVELYLKMLEFAVPKLTRAEVSVETDEGRASRELDFDELEALVMQGIAAREQAERTIEGESEDVTTGPDTT